jgi:uncharacterized protein (DUF1501 family)
MDRKQFLRLTGTVAGGLLMMPDFLYSFGMNDTLAPADSCLLFIQLDGGNDGLNTYIPYNDPIYYNLRPNIAIAKNDSIAKSNNMGWHPSLKAFAEMQNNGDLAVIQNVGYPEPVTSHFRSQEIWQTGSGARQYLTEGWLGRYLDSHYKEHHPTAGINIDRIDNLALKGNVPNSITLAKPEYYKSEENAGKDLNKLSSNPRLDFVRKIALSIPEGAAEVQKAIAKSAASDVTYPKTDLAKNLELIAKLIKGSLNSKVYYTSFSGFDTHYNQLALHSSRLTVLNDAVYSLYRDLRAAKKLEQVTIVVFSEFGRRAKDNGKGTDHGTAAPVFVIGGKTKGKVIGKNPDLANLDENKNLIHQIDFRSVYASLLKDKLSFDPAKIGISNKAVQGIF